MSSAGRRPRIKSCVSAGRTVTVQWRRRQSGGDTRRRQSGGDTERQRRRRPGSRQKAGICRDPDVNVDADEGRDHDREHGGDGRDGHDARIPPFFYLHIISRVEHASLTTLTGRVRWWTRAGGAGVPPQPRRSRLGCRYSRGDGLSRARQRRARHDKHTAIGRPIHSEQIKIRDRRRFAYAYGAVMVRPVGPGGAGRSTARRRVSHTRSEVKRSPTVGPPTVDPVFMTAGPRENCLDN